MNLFDIFLLAVGLSMDSFAASVSAGAGRKHFSVRYTLRVALTLAVFQAAMPVVGWFAGSHFKNLIVSIDHWIAFALLGFLGGKMIWSHLRTERPAEDDAAQTTKQQCPAARWDTRTLLVVALATSIDALAAGVSLAFLDMRIVLTAMVVFAVTLLFSWTGMAAGVRFGLYLNRWAELAGGAILIGIGTKILVEHLLA